MNTPIILATRNPGKVREMEAILAGLPIELRSLLTMPGLPEVIEDGSTFQSNALKKARAVHDAAGLPALADDSGLEVDALGGEPGIYSARYAGEDATYSDNNTKLLKNMEGVAAGRRKARFRCVIALVAPNLQVTAEGVCPGRIITEEKGTGGFGYDPLFVPDGYDLTFAQLPPEVKNRISHRAIALSLIRNELRNYLDHQRFVKKS